ncbi:YrbL family protein [Vibrio sp. CK2-1]|uniref:YrbL family protein n=1 Tax=Vibrio sp. CK2-1 TaxID=2912249 RepID=UPI001F20B339|nr:YrbL family protein [Vibrio sp. CK2-1]MCF7355393.1 YrbL family protein [Vibrio sp. CK2-1]
MNEDDIKNQQFLEWVEFGSGLGNERRCFQYPNDKYKCIKVSRKNQSKQTHRELKYFNFLQRMSVPFIHVPKFYGSVESREYIGIVQEIIKDDDGSISKNLVDFILYDKVQNDKRNIILYSLNELKCYLLKYNVIPCDLMMTNILIKKTNDSYKAILIDGLGSSSFISLDNYIPFLGRRTIERKWTRFLHNELIPRLDDID